MTEEYISKHINIKTKLITKVITLTKLQGLGGETFWPS
jgi:hypothetical protein